MRRRTKTYWCIVAQPEGAPRRTGWLFTAAELTRLTASRRYRYIEDGSVFARVSVYADDVCYIFGQRMVRSGAALENVQMDTRHEWRHSRIRACRMSWTKRVQTESSQLNTIQL